MNYGYYVAATGDMHGDVALSYLAALYWQRLGHGAPSRVCGSSVERHGDGTATLRISARDFFKNDVKQFQGYPAFEVPHIHTITSVLPESDGDAG